MMRDFMRPKGFVSCKVLVRLNVVFDQRAIKVR